MPDNKVDTSRERWELGEALYGWCDQCLHLSPPKKKGRCRICGTDMNPVRCIVVPNDSPYKVVDTRTHDVTLKPRVFKSLSEGDFAIPEPPEGEEGP